MYGLNPFAQGIDPLELLKVKGLLGSTFAPPPMAPQPMQQPQMAQAAPEPPPMMAPQGQQMLPDMPVGRPPQPDQPPMQVPMPPRRPESFGPEGGLPSLVGQPMPNMGPESATPDQRQMAASSAGKPQDVRPNDPISGFDSGLDKMMTDPLFNMGIALLANPRNIGQGLASGLQNWTTASRQAKRDKLAEEASKRKNIHWFMRPDGTLAGVDADNPTQLISPPGQTPRTQGDVISVDGRPYLFDKNNPQAGAQPIPGLPEQQVGHWAKPEELPPNYSGPPVWMGGKGQAPQVVGKEPKERTYADRQAEGEAMGLQGDELRQFTLTGKYKPAGAAGTEKITESQAKDAAYASRMQASDKIIGDPAAIDEASSKLKGSFEAGASNIPILGNMLISDRYRKLDQAKRDFINADLRRQSGAHISPAEFENANKQYFPQPGDDPITLENKRLNRITAMEGVAYGGAPSFRKQFFGEDAPDIARRALERQQESERKRSGATGSVQAAPQIDRDAAIAEARRRGLIK